MAVWPHETQFCPLWIHYLRHGINEILYNCSKRSVRQSDEILVVSCVEKQLDINKTAFDRIGKLRWKNMSPNYLSFEMFVRGQEHMLSSAFLQHMPNTLIGVLWGTLHRHWVGSTGWALPAGGKSAWDLVRQPIWTHHHIQHVCTVKSGENIEIIITIMVLILFLFVII